MTTLKWVWQLEEWPNFTYQSDEMSEIEKQFLQNSGMLIGAFQHVDADEKDNLIINIMSDEALKTSEIEGEHLNRDSIQASIRKNMGLETDNRKISPEEYGIATMMVDLYRTYSDNLTHDMLFKWHKLITNGRQDLKDIGKYRTHDDAMQIVSGRLDILKVHYEAPPSSKVWDEMDAFMRWFDKIHKNNKINPLTRAGIAHFYFENIHPFEDGNGRIGRAIAEKSIAMSLNNPAFISLSQIIHQNKKAYYATLEAHNRTLEITDWLVYFGKTICKAQKHSQNMLDFTIEKGKFFGKYEKLMNERQLKAIRRMFAEGYLGFKGGLSANNYMKITQATASTATRDLQDLVENDILCRTGERRGTRYWLNIKGYQ